VKKLIELVKQRWKNILLLVTLGHFVFFIFQNRDIADLNVWERNTCYFKTHRELLDMDCRYYHVKRFVFAQPNLAYGETLKCKQASADKVKKFDQEVLSAECPAQDIWGSPKKIWDLGWDAYSICSIQLYKDALDLQTEFTEERIEAQVTLIYRDGYTPKSYSNFRFNGEGYILSFI
jgi:hypothetical protein